MPPREQVDRLGSCSHQWAYPAHTRGSFRFRHLYNTSATVKIKRVTQKEFPAKMVVATQTRRRETPMSHYQHLTISERESIWENKLAGKSLREIARQTGRSVSTISRELKRNGTSQKYRPSEAQKKYERRRKRCRRKNFCKKENSKTWLFVC